MSPNVRPSPDIRLEGWAERAAESSWATTPDAWRDFTSPEARRPCGRGTGKPGTLTARAPTSSREPRIVRQSPEIGAERATRTCSAVIPGRREPATQMP